MDCGVWAVGPCPFHLPSLLKTVSQQFHYDVLHWGDCQWSRIHSFMRLELMVIKWVWNLVFSPLRDQIQFMLVSEHLHAAVCILCVHVHVFGHLIVTGPKSVASKSISTLHSLRCTIMCHKREMFHWFIKEMKCHTLPILPQTHCTFSKPWTTPLLNEVQKVPTQRILQAKSAWLQCDSSVSDEKWTKTNCILPVSLVHLL